MAAPPLSGRRPIGRAVLAAVGREARIGVPRLSRPYVEAGVIALGHGVTHWYVNGFFLVVPFITNEYALSYTEAGLLVAYRTVLSAIFNLPSGALVDWLGKRRLVMAVSAAWSGVVYGLVSISPNYVILQLTVALIGIGNITWHPAAMATLVERLPGRKGFALALHEFGANLGDALAPAAIGALLVFLDWREVLRLNLLPGLALALVVWLVVVDPPRPAGHRPDLRIYLAGLRATATNRLLLATAAVSSLRTMSQNVIQTFLPLYLLSGLGLAADAAGFYVALLTLPALVSGLVVGSLSDRLGRKPMMMCSLALSGGLCVLLALAQRGLPFAVALAALGLVLFSIRPVIFAFAMEATSATMGGTTVGLMFGLNTVLSGLSPVLAGLLADRVGLLSAFYLSAGLLLAAATGAALLPAPRRKPALSGVG